MGDLGGVLGIAEEAVAELLERQRAEGAASKLELALDLRQKFFALVSHDLRQPLTAIKASAELILRHPQRAELCAALSSRIVESVNRADRLIVDLLDANRLRAGLELVLNVARVDLHALVAELLFDLSIVHAGRCRYDEPEACVGFWDPKALRRAVENLVSNAVKYGDAEAPVTLKVERQEGTIQISVHNHGNPIAPLELENLFQWHERTAAAQMSGQTGWGLGLMLVKGIAEAHGGVVRVRSSAEEGTTFTIELPLDARPFLKV